MKTIPTSDHHCEQETGVPDPFARVFSGCIFIVNRRQNG
jgi:hypothetical protein